MMTILSFIWDPQYIGIPIGDFTIRFYSMMYILGFTFAFYMMYYIFKMEGKPKTLLDPLLMYAIVGMLIGMRLGEVFGYNWDYYKDHLLEIFLPFKEDSSGNWHFTGFSGLASHGATIGFLISFLIYKYKYLRNESYFWLVDRVCIPIVLGGAFVRIGNFINSEIIGKAVSETFIFATQFPQMSGEDNLLYRHPSQLYESFGYLLLFLLVTFLFFKTNLKKREGFIFGIIFICLFTIRFLVEFTKENQVDSELGQYFNNGQLYSIPMIFIGFGALVYSLIRKPKN